MPHSSDLQPGDLVLVTKRDDDPLAKYVSELDGSPYSHCGIAVSDTLVANCRTAPSEWDVNDTGGVRLDEVSVFTDVKRSVYRSRPKLSTAELEHAVEFVCQFSQDSRPGALDSSFGFAKLFIVSCGLAGRSGRSKIPENSRSAIFDAAADAARAASWTTNRASFFCSDLVAAAYGKPFSVADFDPPRPPREIGWLPRIPHSVAGLLERLETELQGARAKWELGQLVLTMLAHGLGHVVEAWNTNVDWRRWAESQPHPDPVEAPAPDPGTSLPVRVPAVVQPRDALPTGLVTPRMLAKAPWVDEAVLIAEPS